MPLLNSVYLAFLVLQDYIPLPRSKLWAQLNASIFNVLQVLRNVTNLYFYQTQYCTITSNEEELRLCRSVWWISFFIALVAGFITVYLLRFLQKFVEIPRREFSFATSWLPRQLTVKHMKHKSAAVLEDPPLAQIIYFRPNTSKILDFRCC